MVMQHQTRREALLVCLGALVAFLASAGLAAGAMLVPAPPAVVPVVATICVICPVFAAWELPGAVAALRAASVAGRERAVARMRRALERLPETEHPLGL